jgi:hypothetical protein
MDIKRLPPSLLVALGLAGCGPTVNPDDDSAGDASASEGTTTEASTSACLDVAFTESDTTGGMTTGPCLGQEQTTTGPCLAPEPSTGSGSDSGSGSGSSSDSGSGGSSDEGSGSVGMETTTGPCLAPPGDAPDDGGQPESPLRGASARAEILQRVLSAGVLPPDVAAKLKA